MKLKVKTINFETGNTKDVTSYPFITLSKAFNFHVLIQLELIACAPTAFHNCLFS